MKVTFRPINTRTNNKVSDNLLLGTTTSSIHEGIITLDVQMTYPEDRHKTVPKMDQQIVGIVGDQDMLKRNVVPN